MNLSWIDIWSRVCSKKKVKSELRTINTAIFKFDHQIGDQRLRKKIKNLQLNSRDKEK